MRFFFLSLSSLFFSCLFFSCAVLPSPCAYPPVKWRLIRGVTEKVLRKNASIGRASRRTGRSCDPLDLHACWQESRTEAYAVCFFPCVLRHHSVSGSNFCSARRCGMYKALVAQLQCFVHCQLPAGASAPC
ncbi:hypothetical protein QBC46DRAFT_384982 [Diplogelasinospora grovesii]|uniref:Secreted protein n=1 Tax=Diplogelasinospora grovesii TaxID=303347 RepID=A0AAN6S4V9_9PEZI|nr:hypothetical protein QBC46DRAFT_384982 [Diplogelasinospora grovesii]